MSKEVEAELRLKARTNSQTPWGGCCAVLMQSPERFLSRTLGGQNLGNTWVQQVSLLWSFPEPLMDCCTQELTFLGESLFALAARKLRDKFVASGTMVCVPAVFSLPLSEYPCNMTKILFGTRQGIFFFRLVF